MNRDHLGIWIRICTAILLSVTLGTLSNCGGGGGGGGGGAVAPAGVGLLSPANTAVGVAVNPQLSWVDASDEDSYTVQISLDVAFTAPLAYEKTGLSANTTTFTVPAGELRINTGYYWRIVKVNTQGQIPSAAFGFTTKNAAPDPYALVSPANNTPDVSLTPTLSWTDAIGASLYTVETSTDATFASSVATALAPTTTQFTVPSPLQEWTTYYWRVQSLNSVGTVSAANAPFSFKTKKNGSPDAFNLTAPANAATGVLLTPDLTWSSAYGVTTYTVLIAPDALFTIGTRTYANISASTTTLSVPSGDLAETTTYYWRVIAVNGTGSTNSNETRTFTTKRVTAPSVFSLATPTNEATGVLFPVTVSWNDAVGEDSYTLEISTDNFVTTTTTTFTAGITSYTIPSGTLQAGTQYSWRVTAVNGIGSTPATAPFSFTTKESGKLVWAQMVDPSASFDDEVYGIAVDANALYAVGYDSNTSPKFDDQWRIEKRGISNGSLITSFGTLGVAVSNPSAATINSFDDANAISIDSMFMYVVGFDAVPDVATGAASLTDDEWRIEKRRLDTGALDTSFGSAGVIVSNPSSTIDEATAIAIDSQYMYVVGYDTTPVRDKEWRIEKRELSTGAPVTAFGANGVVLSDPSGLEDKAKAIALDGTHLFVAGHESAGSAFFQWRIEKMRLDTGAYDASFGASGVVTVPTVTGNSSISTIAVDAQYLYVAGYVTVNIGNTAWVISIFDKANGSLVQSVTSNPNPSGSNAPKAIVIDSNYAYIAGYDTSVTQKEWRIEKRNLSNLSLVTSFATNGVYLSHPSAASALDDDVWAMSSDAAYLYVAGYDKVPGTRQWRIEKIVK